MSELPHIDLACNGCGNQAGPPLMEDVNDPLGRRYEFIALGHMGVKELAYLGLFIDWRNW